MRRRTWAWIAGGTGRAGLPVEGVEPALLARVPVVEADLAEVVEVAVEPLVVGRSRWSSRASRDRPIRGLARPHGTG